jgi:dTDP-4-dehydrorhamnose 3,5-epimerase
MTTEPLDDMRISMTVLPHLDVQDYTPTPRIEGVEVRDLHTMSDEGGSFMELGRFEAGAMEGVDWFNIRQVNYSVVEPGAIKAWHLHYNQEDIWFVPPWSRLLVGLWDLRAGSETEGSYMRFVLGGGRARQVVIPRGVAHGCANLSLQPVPLLYFVNQQFSLDEPDERRLDWDYFGADFWEMDHG